MLLCAQTLAHQRGGRAFCTRKNQMAFRKTRMDHKHITEEQILLT